MSQTSNRIEVPLYRWCSDYFIRLGQHVYFGKLLDQVDPSLPDTFLAFDELIWKMLYGYPSVLSRDMSIPRAQVIASLKKYFQVPQAHRGNGVAWLVNAMEDETRALGVNDDNLAVIIFHLYLACVSIFRERSGPCANSSTASTPTHARQPSGSLRTCYTILPI